jgi:hypothetical protein
MNLKKSIKKLFQSEPFTIAALESVGLINELVKNENGSAFIIEMEQSNLVAKITIPIDVYEIFIDIEFEDRKIKGWDDFYGETKEEDYKQKLSEIKEVRDGGFQISIENNTIYLRRNEEEEQWF